MRLTRSLPASIESGRYMLGILACLEIKPWEGVVGVVYVVMYTCAV